MSVRTLVKSIQNIMRKDPGVDGDAQRISQLCWMFFLKIIDDQDRELEMMSADYASPIPEQFQWRAWAADPEGITGGELLAFVDDDLFPALKNLRLTGNPGDRRRVVRDVFEDAYNYMKSGQLMRQVVNKINGIDFNNLTERQHFGDIYEQILNDLQSAGNAGEYYTPRAVTAFIVDRIDPKPGETLFDPACGTGGFLTSALRHMRGRYVKRPEDERIMQTALRAVEKKQLPHMLCVTNMLLHSIEDPSFVRHDNTLARPYIGWEQKGPGRYRADQSALWRQGRRRHRKQLPTTLSNQGDGGPVPGPDRPPVEADGPRGRGLARRIAVRRGCQNPAQGASDGGMQPPHHCPPAQFRVPTLRLHRNQPAVLREGRTDRGHLVLRTPGARRAESLFHDPADSAGASAGLHRLVGRGGAQGPEGDRTRLEGDGRRGQGARLQPRHQEPAHAGRRPRRSSEELLAKLTAAEAETSALRDRLKAILAEALLR